MLLKHIIFKVMNIDPRNKWRKTDSLNLNRSSIDTVKEVKWRSSTQTRFIENYDFRNSRSKIRPILYYLIRISFLTTLVIYKAYFKSHHTQIQRPRTRGRRRGGGGEGGQVPPWTSKSFSNNGSLALKCIICPSTQAKKLFYLLGTTYCYMVQNLAGLTRTLRLL